MTSGAEKELKQLRGGQVVAGARGANEKMSAARLQHIHTHSIRQTSHISPDARMMVFIFSLASRRGRRVCARGFMTSCAIMRAAAESGLHAAVL